MRRYESYKDSGVEWLGEVPSHWGLTIGMNVFRENKRDNKGMKEKTVLSLSYGQIIIKPEEKLVGLVPESFETYQIVEPNDIIIRCTDLQNDQTSLRTGLAKDKGIITSAYLNLKVINNYSAKFLHYYLHTLDITKVLYKFGSGLRQNLSFLDFKRLPIIDIPLSEQQKIAQFLDDKTAKIDQAVDLAEKQIALLKEHKQILIQNAVTRGLNPDVPLKDSGVEWIGQVPEHWEVKKITHIFPNIGSGTTPNSSDPSFYEGNINWLQTGDLTDGYIYKTSKTITHKALQAYSTLKIYPKNSLVIAMYGATIGKVGLLQIETTTNQACCVLSTALNIEMKYVFYLFQGIKESLVAMSYGGGQPNISQEKIKSLKLPFPNASEQEQIADYLDKQTAKIDQAIALKTAHIEKLKEYKSVLIDYAVTGKVRVSV
ncbi:MULTISPECIES: restriction endonuclease subunit S [Neisseria]|uniref:restriction endonuclease subunit S n=1 Tax=Neisseria TaxID=482 RepID=UPI0008A956BF|nr:restriction endonuclease subunit S [Neisseria sp. HMSC064D07]OHQ05812.1 restriction endonuclease subunit S [Neisseria sp. HMSC064D07]